MRTPWPAIGGVTLVAGWLIVATGTDAAQAPHIKVEILLISGQRMSGTLERVDGRTFVLRTDRGQTRRAQRDEIAVIDFDSDTTNLPRSEYVDAMPEHEVLLMQNGSRELGRLVSIEPSARDERGYDVTFRAMDGRRDTYADHQVRRIYLREPLAVTAATTAPPGQRRAPETDIDYHVTVPATVRWTPTNLDVRQGDYLTFNSNGRIRLSADARDMANVAGSLNGRRPSSATRRAPMPDESAGALIGRIGDGQPFGIGDQTQPLPMPNTGPLFLGVNDDVYEDNDGAFHVTIRRVSGDEQR